MFRVLANMTRYRKRARSLKGVLSSSVEEMAEEMLHEEIAKKSSNSSGASGASASGASGASGATASNGASSGASDVSRAAKSCAARSGISLVPVIRDPSAPSKVMHLR